MLMVGPRNECNLKAKIEENVISLKLKRNKESV